MVATISQRAVLTHLEGCPRKGERVETYATTRPSGQKVEITRCGDCGAQEIRNA